jgi:nitrate ABC transporter ATP-binding subunit
VEVVVHERVVEEKNAFREKIGVTDLTLVYGQQEILRRISLTVHEGEFLVIMGPSGCGKSTLLRVLSGLTKPTEGNLRIDGEPVTAPSVERAVVFQDYSLFPWLTARENIVVSLQQAAKNRSRRMKKRELAALAEQYLALVQLGHAAGKYPGQLSGGMKQRVAIARALAQQPEILLMDEPFGALDPMTRVHLQDLLCKIWEEQRQTIVFVTHDVEEAIFLADRIVVFTPGPPGEIAAVLEIPFPRPRNRKKLFLSSEFDQLRDRILSTMNAALISKLEEPETVTASAFI